MAKQQSNLSNPAQEFFAELFTEDQIRAIRESQDETAFEEADFDVATDYCCPSCGYEWNGRPRPNASDEVIDGASE